MLPFAKNEDPCHKLFLSKYHLSSENSRLSHTEIIMAIPQSNYLKNTIPELEDTFIEIIGEIPLFGQLSNDLRHQLFQYAKFLKLKPKEPVIQQGMFDQEIFILLEGKLNVFIQDHLGNDVLIDVMADPFTLFGERSLLGEPRGASILSDEYSLLLGIDLSSLPDMLDGVDSPENRDVDEVYTQNVAMYTVFATVLTQRLERLVRDQYKLRQKVGEFQKRQTAWTREWLLSRIFNQLNSDKLPLYPEIREIFQRKFKKYNITDDNLLAIINSSEIRTRHLYMEMVRLQTLGDLDHMHNLVFDLISDIATFLYNHPKYANLFAVRLSDAHDIPDLMGLSDFFNTLYETILDSKVLNQSISKVEFLDALLQENNINPLHLINTLEEKGWTENQFSLAYVAYLICQQSIYFVSQTNQIIGDYVHFLSTYNAPKQTSLASGQQSSAIVQQFADMQAQQQLVLSSEDTAQESEPSQSDSGSTQEDADDLLKSLGL